MNVQAVSPWPSVLALAVVLAVIVGLGWVLKRARLPGLSSAVPMRTVGTLHIGPRERVMIVEIGNQWHVLGVTAQSINAIDRMDATPAVPADGSAATGSPLVQFGQVLADRLKGKRS
ncbi:N/A [soil metagenome]